MPSGIELEHFAGDVALSTDTSFGRLPFSFLPSPTFRNMMINFNQYTLEITG